MIPRILVTLLSCFLAIGTVNASQRELSEFKAKLTKVIHKHFPKAEIKDEDSDFKASHGTMIFTVHSRWKTGEFRSNTRKVVGPNHEGFLLTVSLNKGPYQGAALAPQTINEVYWSTGIFRPMTKDKKSHFVINFSYGNGLNKKFITEVLRTIPQN